MKEPKMIIFDYGQTLVAEDKFDGIRGTKAVLEQCVNNPRNIPAEEIQLFADTLVGEIRRIDPESGDYSLLEVHNHVFQNFLYDYFGIERTVSPTRLETVFHDAASPGRPTEHISEFLDYLNQRKMRTAVISNISFSGAALAIRINGLIPNNHFEFMMASSEYVFRKPYKRIFELAVRKANLKPEDVWYCGDHAIFDVDGAQNAGLMPVWYKGAIENENAMPSQECLTINDWRELIDVLERLNEST